MQDLGLLQPINNMNKQAVFYVHGNSQRVILSKMTNPYSDGHWTSIKTIMASLGFFLVTTLTGLTTAFPEDLISVIIKPNRLLKA